MRLINSFAVFEMLKIASLLHCILGFGNFWQQHFCCLRVLEFVGCDQFLCPNFWVRSWKVRQKATSFPCNFPSLRLKLIGNPDFSPFLSNEPKNPILTYFRFFIRLLIRLPSLSSQDYPKKMGFAWKPHFVD